MMDFHAYNLCMFRADKCPVGPITLDKCQAEGPFDAANGNDRCDSDGTEGIVAIREGRGFRLVLQVSDEHGLPVASAASWIDALIQRRALCDQLRLGPILAHQRSEISLSPAEPSPRRGSLARARRARFLTRRHVGRLAAAIDQS